MKTFEARITALKIEADKINRAKAAEAQAKAAEEAKARQAIIDRDARFMAVINEVPGKALAHALENNIKMPELHSYLAKGESKYNLAFFEGSQKHYDLFNEAYARAFRDYDLALENKEIALKRQAEIEAAERAKAAEQTKGATLMNAMDAAIAPTVEPVIDVKIKRSYKAQIDTSEAWATTVWAAFLANRAKVIHKVRQADTRDWSKVTAVQLAEALAAVKNDDNAFDVKGVVFVEEVK